jgi:hypothetical protein
MMVYPQMQPIKFARGNMFKTFSRTAQLSELPIKAEFRISDTVLVKVSDKINGAGADYIACYERFDIHKVNMVLADTQVTVDSDFTDFAALNVFDVFCENNKQSPLYEVIFIDNNRKLIYYRGVINAHDYGTISTTNTSKKIFIKELI